MHTQYKHIEFVKMETCAKTSVWECRHISSAVYLGEVKWHSPWRQYGFYTDENDGIILSQSCLRDIANFIGQLMDARKDGA